MEYVKQIKPLFINAHENGYIVGKIYKTYPKYHTPFVQGFINSQGLPDGYNINCFMPATEEEYNIQEGIFNKSNNYPENIRNDIVINQDLSYLSEFLTNLGIT